MDAGHIIVLVFTAGVVVFLVLIEINSRRNEARRAQESSAQGVSTAEPRANKAG